MADSQILPPSPTSPPPPPPPPNTIFRGPNGLRAGWRVLIYVALTVGVGLILGGIGALFVMLFRGTHGGQPSIRVSGVTPLGVGFSETAILLCTGVAAWIMSRIEDRHFGQYGLPLESAFRKDFWIGTLAGFVAISGCLLAIFSMKGFHLNGLAIHGSTILSAALAWAVAFVLVGLAEEFAFRGYLQFTLTSGMGFWPAAVILSALFGLAHAGNPGETKLGLVSVFLFGMLFCLFLLRCGNLWWVVGFHAGWDWGQTFFYGVPDSGSIPYHNLYSSSFSGPTWLTGGSVGPEASIFAPITLVIVAVLFTRVYRENKYQASALSPQAPAPHQVPSILG